MKNLSALAVALLSIFFTSGQLVSAVYTWDDGEGDTLWTSVNNWDPNGTPGTADSIVIGTNPSFGIISVDAGATQIASLSINSGISAFSIDPLGGGDSLRVDGAITNSSASITTLSISTTTGSLATWSGPLSFTGSLSLYTDTTYASISLGGSSNISFAGSLNFKIGSLTSYSTLNNSGATTSFSGASINIDLGSYTPTNGNSWDFTNSNFTGATLNVAGLPTLTPGLTWDSSNFLTNGTLTVVPEPATWALFATSLAAGMAFRSRRRRS